MPTLDEGITRDVVDQLYWDGRVDASKVTVEVTDGNVLLRGSVPSYAASRAAEEDAWVVDGVYNVDNQLKVEPVAATPRASDEDIRMGIVRACRRDANLDEKRIKVVVDGGMVTLEGSVDAFWKKGLAEDIAWHEPDVVTVINQLAIVPTEKIRDEVIAKVVVDAIRRNVYVAAETIDVKVQNGVVTLLGNVPSRHAQLAAYRSALYASGVLDVRNNLVISPVTAPA